MYGTIHIPKPIDLDLKKEKVAQLLGKNYHKGFFGLSREESPFFMLLTTILKEDKSMLKESFIEVLPSERSGGNIENPHDYDYFSIDSGEEIKEQEGVEEVAEEMQKEDRYDLRKLVYELVKAIKIFKSKDKMGLELKLSLEKFGNMEVQLVMDEKKGIYIRFVVKDEVTRSLILSGLNTLKKNLIGSGLDVKGIEVESRKDRLEGFNLQSMPIQSLTGRINLVA